MEAGDTCPDPENCKGQGNTRDQRAPGKLHLVPWFLYIGLGRQWHQPFARLECDTCKRYWIRWGGTNVP
eukprot:g39270.t1